MAEHDDLVRAREKECEKGPLSRAAEWKSTSVLDDLERSQDAELHVSPRGSFSSAAATLPPSGSAEAQRCLRRGSDHRWRPLPAA